MNTPNLCPQSEITMTRTMYVPHYVEPTVKLVMSRCHCYEGPEWVPEWDSPEGWLLRKYGPKKVDGQRQHKPLRYHWEGAHHCGHVCRPHNANTKTRTVDGEAFDKIPEHARCISCHSQFSAA